MEEQERQILFERAYRDELSPQEQSHFENALKNDLAFKQDFELFHEHMALIGAMSFREHVKATVPEAGSLKTKSHPLRWAMGGLAAAVVIVLIVLRPAQVTTAELFDRHFQPLSDVYSKRDLSPNVHVLSSALSYYKDKDYENAIYYFNQVKQPSDTVMLYKAVSQLGLKKPEAALKELRGIRQTAQFSNTVNWYKALAYLLAQKADSCVYTLNLLPREDANQPKARAILEFFE